MQGKYIFGKYAIFVDVNFVERNTTKWRLHKIHSLALGPMSIN
jgi:hypothetical protein